MYDLEAVYVFRCRSIGLACSLGSVYGLNIIGVIFFFQAEDGIRDLVRSRGLGDVYKRQGVEIPRGPVMISVIETSGMFVPFALRMVVPAPKLSLIHI